MKKLLISITVFILLIITSSNAFALYPRPSRAVTPSATREGALERIEIRKELKEQKLQEIQERIQEKKATIAARLAETRKERVRFFFGRLNRRLEAAIDRLEILIERIESRVAIIEEEDEDEDIDTSSIKGKLEEAKALLDEARASLAAAESSLENALSSDDPMGAFAIIRETIQEIKNDLIEVHRILVHVIGDIKGLRVGQSS